MGGSAYVETPEVEEKKPELVPLTKEAIQAYLDKAIITWRDSKEEHAKFYIDAFQSVRTSLLGELLPPKEV
jgi:hypothetical protein